MSIFLKVLHLTFSVTFFLPFKFVNIITKAQKAFESKYSWKELDSLLTIVESIFVLLPNVVGVDQFV